VKKISRNLDEEVIAMERIREIEQPGLVIRACYKIGERMFGKVPTPERIMAHRFPLMLGLGALYGAIEWFGRIETELRALLNIQVAALYGSPY
jgi:hypothetical protein